MRPATASPAPRPWRLRDPGSGTRGDATAGLDDEIDADVFDPELERFRRAMESVCAGCGVRDLDASGVCRRCHASKLPRRGGTTP